MSDIQKHQILLALYDLLTDWGLIEEETTLWLVDDRDEPCGWDEAEAFIVELSSNNRAYRVVVEEM